MREALADGQMLSSKASFDCISVSAVQSPKVEHERYAPYEITKTQDENRYTSELYNAG